jgi:hypothetical protein
LAMCSISSVLFTRSLLKLHPGQVGVWTEIEPDSIDVRLCLRQVCLPLLKPVRQGIVNQGAVKNPRSGRILAAKIQASTFRSDIFTRYHPTKESVHNA